jgi:regulator of sigma E protease
MFILDILAFFLVLTPIVLVHELGHFIAAVRNGIKVEEFGLFLPPRALTLFRWRGTNFTLNWIPLGGFVRPSGEDDPNVEGGLASASKRVRFTVLVAGAAANFLMAYFLFFGAFLLADIPVLDESSVALSLIQEGDPAALAGLQEGDIVRQINGVEINSTDEMISVVQAHPGETVDFVVEREGRLMTIPVTPEMGPSGEIGRIGVGVGPLETGETVRYGILEAGTQAGAQIVRIVGVTLRVPFMLLQGEVSVEEVGFVGPPSIARGSREAAQASLETGDWFTFLSFVGFINVALGFTNLLPIPALDGGRILFVLIEAVRGRRVEPEREAVVHVVGMVLLLGLMALVFVNDLMNPFDFNFR